MKEQLPAVTYAVQALDQTGEMRAPYLICKGFHAAGWQVMFVTLANSKNTNVNCFWNSVPVEKVFEKSKKRQLLKMASGFMKKKPNQVVISWVWDWHCFFLALSKVLFNNHYAIVMDTYTFKASPNSVGRLKEELRYGFVLRNADIIMAETPACFNQAQKLLKRPHSMLVPSCFWKADFQSIEDAWAEENCTPVRRPVILYVGRVLKKKNLHDLITAFSRVSEKFQEWSIEIRGPVWDEGYFASLQALVTSLSLDDRVHFLSPVYGTELYRVYRESSIFALPSEAEGFPSVVLEAMYFGGAIVAANSGYVSYQLDEGNCGMLHASGDVDELTRCLGTLISSPETRQVYQEKAQKRFSDVFTWEQYYPTIERCFRNLTAQDR